MTGLAVLTAELDTLVYWIEERERIRRRKESGAPKPWTDDAILRDHRWCNVRRMDDRVSRELLEYWYVEIRGWGEGELVYALFGRLVNWPEALDEVRWPMIDSARSVLKARAARGEKVFTGAYVIPGVPGKNKVDSVCDLITVIRSNTRSVFRQPTMRGTWAELIKFDGMGSFLAGQVVADLAHLSTGAAWPDRDSWAPIGPGSARGINRLRGIPKDKPVRQEEFERLLPALIAELQPRIRAIWDDRALQAMDVQNCLCEFDKYRRLQLGEGTVRARYPGAATAEQSALPL